MKRILEILLFLSGAIQAITEGAKVAHSKWPSDNPFKKTNDESKQPQSGFNQPADHSTK